jgi:hypothetical protein
MMDVSRHKSVDTLRGYVRDADAFRDHAGAGLLGAMVAATLKNSLPVGHFLTPATNNGVALG